MHSVIQVVFLIDCITMCQAKGSLEELGSTIRVYFIMIRLCFAHLLHLSHLYYGTISE